MLRFQWLGQRVRATAGLGYPVGLARDPAFWLVLVAGAASAAAASAFTASSARVAHASAAFLLALLIVQPLLEELVFRGVVQGWLSEFAWGAHQRLGLSAANWLTSVVFALAHVTSQPPVWAAAVFLPSLVFGHFRDRYGSVWPAVILHVVFNAAFFLTPVAASRVS